MSWVRFVLELLQSNYRELKRRYDLDGADRTVQHLSESLREGNLQPEDFSIRDLAEALVPDGKQWVHRLDPRSGGNISVMESSDGVDANEVIGSVDRFASSLSIIRSLTLGLLTLRC